MRLLLIPFVLAQVADLGTTITNLSLGCTELNPLYHGSTLQMVSTKGLVTVGLCLGILWLEHRGNLRHARLVAWTGIMAAGVAALWNASIMPYCGG